MSDYSADDFKGEYDNHPRLWTDTDLERAVRRYVLGSQGRVPWGVRHKAVLAEGLKRKLWTEIDIAKWRMGVEP